MSACKRQGRPGRATVRDISLPVGLAIHCGALNPTGVAGWNQLIPGLIPHCGVGADKGRDFCGGGIELSSEP